MSSPAELEGRVRAVLDEGRTLVRGGESLVAVEDPFLLAARSHGANLELAIRRVTTFAFVLAAVVGTLIATGAAPWLLGVIVGAWVTASIAARVFAARRRHQHGSLLIDFERGRVHATTLAGEALDVSLGESHIRTERSADEQAPVWIVLVVGRRLLRLGRASHEQAERTLAVFRRYHVRVERQHGGD